MTRSLTDPKRGPSNPPYRTCAVTLEWNREPTIEDCRECPRTCGERLAQ